LPVIPVTANIFSSCLEVIRIISLSNIPDQVPCEMRGAVGALNTESIIGNTAVINLTVYRLTPKQLLARVGLCGKGDVLSVIKWHPTTI